MRIDSGGRLLIGSTLVLGTAPPNGKLFVGGVAEQIQIGGGFIQRTGSCGIAFSGAVVLPVSEGAVTVSATDLGRTANRWRTIYLANQPNVSSDATTKTVIGDTKGLDFISALRPVEFTRIAEEAQTKYMGFIAQEVKALTGDGYGVVYGEEGSMGMAYAELIAPLVKAIQELTARLEVLEA
jgi:subtilisin family serine protease